MPADSHLWRVETLTSDMLGALDEVRSRAVAASFYLAGGAGLALQLGHRQPAELDYFTEARLNPEALLVRLEGAPGLQLVRKSEAALEVTIGGIRVNFAMIRYPLLFPLKSFHETLVADSRDIACTGISAIAARGARRDFIDLYAVAQHDSLDSLLEMFARKFAAAGHSRADLLRSLTSFEEAEREPMPRLLAKIDWERVKRFFLREARYLQ
jgi:hypothetical protein